MDRSQRVIVLLVRGMIVLSVLLVGRQLWTTDLGMNDHVSAGRRIVTEVDPGGAADRAGIVLGDEIVSDPGLITYVEPWTEREVYEWCYRLHVAIESGHVPIRIRRGDREMTVDVRPDPAPNLPAALRQLRRMGTDLPVVIAFLAVAALLSRKSNRSDREERARRIVVASCALYGPCWVVQWAQPGWPLWLYPVSNIIDAWCGYGATLFLALFAWSYPVRFRIVDSRFARAVTVVGGLVACAFSTASSMHLVGGPFVLHGNSAMIFLASVVALSIMVALVFQWRKAPDVIARRQSAWLLATFGIAMLVPVFLLLVPQRLFGWTSVTMHLVLFAFPMLIPIGLAVVVARYRLFSLDGIALRAGPYAIAVVTSITVCIALSVGLQTILAWRSGAAGDAARWTGTIAAILVIEPIRRLVQVLVDRVFARDRDAFIRQCSTLAAKLARATDARAIEREVSEVLDARTVKLVSLADVVGAAPLPAIQRALGSSGAVRAVDLPDATAVDELMARGLEILVATSSDDRADPASSLVLALTLPGSGQRMEKSERDALALVGKVIGAALGQRAAERALESALLRSENERRHIAMELHDGLGATLTAARLMARRLRDPAGTVDGPATTLEALESTLRDGLGDLRASLWSLDPGEGSWDAVLGRVQRHASDLCAAAGVELVMTNEGELSSNVSGAARLAMTRIVQEAVNNALKHGAPKTITIRTVAVKDQVDVTIEDDGAGIVANAATGRGLGNITRRVESLGGTFRLEPRSGGGTSVSVSIPVLSAWHIPVSTPEVLP